MKKYQYQTLRYVHDQFTNEFGNVGIVLYSPEEKFLSCKIISRFSRLSDFFGDINGHFLLKSLKHFEKSIAEVALHLKEFQPTENTSSDLGSITNSILPKDDSALILSDVVYGIDVQGEMALAELFERIVDKYNNESQTESHTDSYVWKNIYKNHFDKYGITQKLQNHTIKTSKDKIDFDKAWKNGVWHCYQSLSFDLKRDETIKNKAYKWSGILRELETSEEAMNLYFLTTSPSASHAELKSFITDTLSLKSKLINVSIIDEKEADNFAATVKKDMEESNIFANF